MNNIDKVNTIRNTINRIYDDVSNIANCRELAKQELLQMLLRRISWELDNSAGALLQVKDDLVYNSQSNYLEQLKTDLSHANKRINDLMVRLDKYEPKDKLTAEEIEAGKFNKINAIKLVRARTGLGLKEAKDLVETVYPYVPAGSVTTPTNIPF